MRRRRKLVLLGIFIGLPLLLLTCAVLYLTLADLSGWRDTVAELLSESLGRELQIAGDFEPDIGLTTSVRAGDISLANAEWSSEPTMASIGHLAVEVDLLSLLFQPIRIHRLELDGVRVLLEVDNDGRANWEFETEDDGQEESEPLELALGQIDLDDVEVVYRDPSLDQEIALGASHSAIRGDDADMLDLQFDGHFNRSELAMTARLGPLAGLLQLRDVEHDLSGHLGGIEFSSRGRIADLITLGGADLTARLHGKNLAAIGEVFELDEIGSGPFSIDLGVNPAAEGFTVEIGASASGITAEVSGAVDSLLEPGVLDLTVEASGPDVRAVGALTGVEGLPGEAFVVTGRVRWEGFPIACDNVEVRVGENVLSAHGVFGEPPLMLGTDFAFDGEGPDISSLAALAGVSLPKDRFTVGGRLVRLADGVGIQEVEARVGRNTIAIDGTVGDPPEYTGTALTLHAKGPNLAYFQDLAGTELPAEGFEIDGKLVQGEGAITLESVRARLGRNTLRVDGQLTTDSQFAGTDLRLNASGPDASQLAAIADIPDVPAEPYSVDGRVRVLEKGYRVSGLAASLGSLGVRVDGFVAPPPTLVGSDLNIHLEDSDLSHPASIAGITGLPHDAFDVEGRIRVEKAGYRLDGFDAVVGDIEAQVDGLVGQPPELRGTDLQLEARGSRLAALGPYLQQPHLPSAPFSVSGGVRVVDASYLLDQIVVEVGGNRVAVAGTVTPSDKLAGTDLEVEIGGPDLSEAGRLAAGFVELPELPSEPYSLIGRVVIDGSGYELQNVVATLAAAAAKVSGRVGLPPSLQGTDITLDLDGPNASLFTAVSGVSVPIAPFQLTGRVERHATGYRFHEFAARLGEYRASVHGSLGELPKLIGTDLEIQASGPGTGLIRDVAGVVDLPDRPFEIAGSFRGTSKRFTMRGFNATFGASDLSGSFRVDLLDTPRVDANFTSNYLDLSGLKETPEPAEPQPAQESPPTEPKDGMLISDEPFDPDVLRRAEGKVAISVGELVLPVNRFRDVELGAQLEGGRLGIERLAAVGSHGGRLDGGLVLEPTGAGYSLQANLSLEESRFELSGTSVDPSLWPPVDVEFEITAAGRSPHGLASAATGHGQIVIGKGVFENAVVDLLVAGVLRKMIDLLNPFAGEEKATELQCAVLAVNIEDGLARLEPLAVQTDKMTMLGSGNIDLGTENIDLEWVTKPRKGIGLSASMITNPYVKLGGTLSQPSVQLKGTEAVASAGVAVATMGVSLVASGLYDRVTAEKKVCKKALEKIEHGSKGSSGKSKKKRR